MDTTTDFIKWIIIAILVVMITMLHYSTIGGHVDLHLIYREFYFLPILLSCIWFGFYQGLATALLIGLFYSPHIFIYTDAHGSAMTVGVQIGVFLAVAGVVGILVERRKRKQADAATADRLAALGRAASVVGSEINANLAVIRRLSAERTETLTEASGAQRQPLEIERLQQLADMLSAFSSETVLDEAWQDLNQLVRKQAERWSKLARPKGIRMLFDFAPQPCHVKVPAARMVKLIEDLVRNALEASLPDRRIWIRTFIDADVCKLWIRDEGTGIRPEHLSKIFTPFFTTKPQGQGLALAASRKFIRDIGGDIVVSNHPDGGAAFTVVLPHRDIRGIHNSSV